MREFGFITIATVSVCAATSSTVFAQSSVTLYGIADAGVDFISNVQTSATGNNGRPRGHSSFSIQDGSSGGQLGSRFGLKGVEDLGEGLKAVFTLENGFTMNNGVSTQGGIMFGRQVFMGLSDQHYGTFTFGRQYDLGAVFVGPLVAGQQWGGYMTSHISDLDNLQNTHRINNSIKYVSPSYKGFSIGGLYSFGGVPGSLGGNQLWSIGAGYKRGPLSLGFGMLNARNPNFSYFGTNGGAKTAVTDSNFGSAGSATSPQSGPIFSGYSSASTTQVIVAGSAYDFGAATVGLVYTNVQMRGLGDTANSGPNPLHYSGNASFNVGEVNFRYQLNPALLVGTSYWYARDSGANNSGGATYQQLNLGVVYSFSKRTAIYGVVNAQRASGTNSLGQPAVANVTGQTPSATNKQLAINIGVRQFF
jgi:predicted porin